MQEMESIQIEELEKLDEVYGMIKHTIRIMKGDRNVAHY